MHNNCNNDYEEIRKRIQEEQNKYRFCYVQGPKGVKGDRGDIGPQGERGLPGPVSIEVGFTETVESFEDAKVENVGTKEDVILHFKIPKGIQGIEGKIDHREFKDQKEIKAILDHKELKEKKVIRDHQLSKLEV